MKFRNVVWAILEPMTNAPHPDPSRQSAEGDPFSTAINSTRGVAMEAVIRYALWVRRRFTSQRE